MNFFLHVVILIFFVHPIHLRRLNLEEYDLYEIKKVSKYNETRLKYGLDPIFFSRELMYFAQEEAGRLAKLGLLEVPKLKTEKSYRGFSVRITEQDGKTFYGKKVCFNNILPKSELSRILDINEKCTDTDLDWRYEYELGYGRAYDFHGFIYGVKIYFTHQTKKINSEEESGQEEGVTTTDVIYNEFLQFLSSSNPELTTSSASTNNMESLNYVAPIIRPMGGNDYYDIFSKNEASSTIRMDTTRPTTRPLGTTTTTIEPLREDIESNDAFSSHETVYSDTTTTRRVNQNILWTLTTTTIKPIREEINYNKDVNNEAFNLISTTRKTHPKTTKKIRPMSEEDRDKEDINRLIKKIMHLLNTKV